VDAAADNVRDDIIVLKRLVAFRPFDVLSRAMKGTELVAAEFATTRQKTRDASEVELALSSRKRALRQSRHGQGLSLQVLDGTSALNCRSRIAARQCAPAAKYSTVKQTVISR
jgi:hypothetical protein